MRPLRTRVGVAALGASVLLAGCGGAGSEATDEATSEATDETTGETGGDIAVETDGAVDECSPVALNDGDEEFVFTSAFRVVDGTLAQRCSGVDDPTIVAAWQSLATIAPAAQLGDLTLFAGFEPAGDNAADTLAFVNALDAEGTSFQMSVNVAEAAGDPDELLLTLAHEFTHVFTSTAAELDRSVEGIAACATYANSEGCYAGDSLMLAWIDEFWDDELLAGVDPLADSADDADARCALDDGFFGPYAATNPEEDFAEAFSAFVFRLEPATDGQADRLDWIARRPGLAEFRDRADAAGMTPLANTFAVCGP
jgi:hypothetical protein